MCWKCVHNLCNWAEQIKLKFLARFKGQGDKDQLIKRFINEEVITNGEEAKFNAKHIARVVTYGKPSWYKKNKIW